MLFMSNCSELHLGSLEPRSSLSRSPGVLWGCRLGDGSVSWGVPPLQCTGDPGTRVHQAGQAAAFLLTLLEPLTWGSGYGFPFTFWFLPIQGLANLWGFLLSFRVCTPTPGGGRSSWERSRQLWNLFLVPHPPRFWWAEHSLVVSASPLNTILNQWTLTFSLSGSVSTFSPCVLHLLPFFTCFPFSPPFWRYFLKGKLMGIDA